MNIKFKGLVTREDESGFNSSVEECSTVDLPDGELLIKVEYSSLNYKDALSAAGNRGVTRSYPHTPGIDAAGVVADSRSPDFKSGDEVIVTGFDLGMNTAGGFGEYIRVPSGWALRLPESLSLKDAMVLGTAGLTAALSVHRMSALISPDTGIIAVSGASGGVGSLSLAILKRAGYHSAAITRKPEQEDYLKELGADEIILRSDIEAGADKPELEKPLLKPRFAGGIDTVGGPILQNIIKSTKPLGAVTCCGNAASDRLDMTVYPFILRGVSLVGIDSQDCPMGLRKEIWGKLAAEWKPEHLMGIYEEIELDELPERIDKMLDGRSRGRVLVRHRS